MDTKYLNVFRTVYETRSLNQAARKLFITPQGLSKSVQQLEQELGVTLFERSSHGMKPTQSADILYARSKSLLTRLEAMEQEVRQAARRTERLRLGAANGVFNLLPFQAVLDFAREQKDVRLEFGEYSNQEVKDMLRSARLEYGLIVGDWDDSEAETRRVGSCDICLLVYEGHPFYSEKEVTIDMLRDETLITMNDKFRMYHDFNDACRVRGFRPNIIARTADANFQYRLCRQRLGLAVIPSFVTDNYSMRGLRALPFRENLQWEVYLACMQGRQELPSIEPLISALAHKK